MKQWKLLLAALVAFGLIAAACGDDDDDASDDGATDGEAAECSLDDLPLKNDGVLTVATGEPVFEPWMVDDDPTNEQGFESGLVYALAAELGVDTVEWVRTGFDEAIAPGTKDYDFNIQQYTITVERDEVVDFSDPYYTLEQTLIAPAGSPLLDATSLADLKDKKLGAATGTTSLQYIDDVIAPDSDASVYDDNAALVAAFAAGQLDGAVFDYPTAYYVAYVDPGGNEIVGVLPRVGDAEGLGMLFEDGSPLVGCVNTALAAIREAGTVDALEDEWLNFGGSVPSLSE